MTEQERLAALIDLELLDTPEEKEFDELVRFASVFCGTPCCTPQFSQYTHQLFYMGHCGFGLGSYRDGYYASSGD